GSATHALRIDGVTPDCPAEIKVEYNCAPVVIKPALDPWEEQAAFRFLYEVFHICRVEQRLTSVIFGCQPKHEAVYKRFGAVPIDSFMNTQLDTTCTVIRIIFVDDYEKRLQGFSLARRHGKQKEYRF